jgi:hypothetical protein
MKTTLKHPVSQPGAFYAAILFLPEDQKPPTTDTKFPRDGEPGNKNGRGRYQRFQTSHHQKDRIFEGFIMGIDRGCVGDNDF